MRNCPKCGIDISNRGPTRSYCKSCEAAWRREYRKKNLCHERNLDKERYKINRKKRLNTAKKYYEEHKKERDEYQKNYQQSKQHKRLNKKWRENNPDKLKEYEKRFYLKIENKIRRSIQSRMSKYLSCSIYSKSFEKILGYTLENLKEHLGNLFEDDMSWDNYGFYGWHIDHIIPVSAFSYDSYEDETFKKCWSLDNLQPLWASDNLSKSNKILEIN